MIEKNMQGKPITESTRRAALLLHAMTASDKKWILGQLDRLDHVVLTGLLDELSELGVPKDAEILAALEEPERKLPVSQGRGDNLLNQDFDKQIRFLELENAHTLFNVLAKEEPDLIAYFLSIYSWPWTEELLNYFDVSVRRQIKASREIIGEAHCLSLGDRLNMIQCELCKEIIAKIASRPAAEPVMTVTGDKNPFVLWLDSLRISNRKKLFNPNS
ncbi:hypothetical protein [Undibacterium sp. Ji49W]|uniref:hypothetical protein n=1 Tax=Undibacterium sp. Ji49W TaxID=3413040 RepID=UPI003BF14BCF